MDETIFQASLTVCKCVKEPTSYLEILNYSNPLYNTIEEHPLARDEFNNFLDREGVFVPHPNIPDSVKLVGGMRLVLQLNSTHPETFTHRCISLSHKEYEDMVREMHLPLNAIEGTSAVGPLFWATIDREETDPHLQIIFRKSDTRKGGLTRGWELMFSHSFRTGITLGYAKSTPSSDMKQHLKDLCACAHQIRHPLLLPLIILSGSLSSETDQKQREARDWLRSLEHAISMRTALSDEQSKYVRDYVVDIDEINRDLAECYARVLWKRPQAYREVIEGMRSAMNRFWCLAGEDPAYGGSGGEVGKLHQSILARLEFYNSRLKGMENYAHVTLERLMIQRAALLNIMAQKDSKLSLQMAGEQRRLAQAAGRENTSMISLFGAIFLPATYIASVFSMSFFDFTPSDSSSSSGASSSSPLSASVSPQLWIYFAITGPLTVLLVVLWRWWNRRQMARYEREDSDVDGEIEKMEMQIMAAMRKRTVSKARVWGERGWDRG